MVIVGYAAMPVTAARSVKHAVSPRFFCHACMSYDTHSNQLRKPAVRLCSYGEALYLQDFKMSEMSCRCPWGASEGPTRTRSAVIWAEADIVFNVFQDYRTSSGKGS